MKFDMEGMMVEAEIENIIQKIEAYKIKDDRNFDSILDCFNSLNGCYKTSNTNLFEKIGFDFKKKFITRNEYADTNRLIYNRNLETYRKTTKDSNKILKDNIETLKGDINGL